MSSSINMLWCWIMCFDCRSFCLGQYSNYWHSLNFQVSFDTLSHGLTHFYKLIFPCFLNEIVNVCFTFIQSLNCISGAGEWLLCTIYFIGPLFLVEYPNSSWHSKWISIIINIILVGSVKVIEWCWGLSWMRSRYHW